MVQLLRGETDKGLKATDETGITVGAGLVPARMLTKDAGRDKPCPYINLLKFRVLSGALVILVLMSASCGGGKGLSTDKITWKGEVKDVAEQGMEDTREPVVYVALGDSTGVGVGARKGGGYVARVFERIERVRPGSRLVNLCVSGATTADVLRTQVARIGDTQPTLITLGIGINDVTRNVPVEQFAQTYEQVITRVREQSPDAPFVATSIPDVSYAPVVPEFMREGARRRIVAYNERIKEIAARHRLHFIDAYEKSHELIPQHPEFFSDDNFHPSDEGYEFWAVLMWPTVKQAIGATE